MAEALQNLLAQRLLNKPPDQMYRGQILPFERNMRTGETSLAWPQMALDAWDAFKLPGDVYAGRVDPLSEEGLARTLGLAATVTGGSSFAPKPADAITMGIKRVPPYKRPPSTVEDYAREIADVLRTGQSSKGNLFRSDLGEITIDKGLAGNPEKDFKGGWGLEHIRDKRTVVDGIDGDAFVRDELPKMLANGRLTHFKGPANGRRATLQTKGEQSDLSLFRNGKKENWLITGFKKNKRPGEPQE